VFERRGTSQEIPGGTHHTGSPAIACIISAYHLPRQLARLVARLQAPRRTFYVHIDLKAPAPVYDEMVAGLTGHDDVHVLPRHVCHWGGFGHVRATLEGLARIADSGTPYDYVVLLTGQDYPIEPNAAIDDWFTRHAGRSFMNHRALPVAAFPDGGYGRLRRRHVVYRGHVRALPSWPFLPAAWTRRVPYGLHPYFGSGYWCLHRAAVEYVVEFLRSHPRYVRFFEHAYVPDEMFFQTILLNSPLATSIVDDDLRYIKWPGPMVLTSANLEEMRASPDLFARKFDERVDAAVLDRIDAELLAPGP